MAAVAVAAPWIGDMMGLSVSQPTGIVMLVSCVVTTMAGLWLLFRRPPPPKKFGPALPGETARQWWERHRHLLKPVAPYGVPLQEGPPLRSGFRVLLDVDNNSFDAVLVKG